MADKEETEDTAPDAAQSTSKPKRSRSRKAADDVGPLSPADDADAQAPSDGSKAQADDTAPAAPTPPQVPPPPGTRQPDYSAQIAADVARPTFGQRLGRAVRRVFGWLIAAVFGLALGLLIFALTPGVVDRVLAPIRANSADIDRLDSEVDVLGAEVTGIKTDQTSDRTDQEAALNDVQAAAERRVAEAETRVAEAEARLADAETRLRDAEDQIADQEALIGEMQSTLDAYAEQLAALEEQVTTLEEEVPGAAEYAAYNRLLILMRAWQELLTARIRLMENNPGLALDVLGEARALLDQAYALSSPEEQAQLDPIIARLDQVITNITASPFAAAGDLEIAWHDLGLLITPPENLLPVEAAGEEASEEEPSVGEPPVPEPREAPPPEEPTPTPES